MADVGMIQSRDGARFPLESVAETFGGNLDRDIAMQPCIGGPIDLAL
jgi:hypothetical protein